MKIEKVKYPSINGLRAISIILVILHHLSIQEHFFSGTENIKWLFPLTSFLQDGHLGVNVFFVISGFLITSLMLHEETRTNTISLKNFYIRRTLRIFPAYYFLLLVYFILQVFHLVNISNASWVTSLTYTKYFNWRLDWLTAHAWSLSIEEHFYLFWPLIFMYARQYRKKTVMGLILTVPLIRVVLFFHPIIWMDELTIFTRIDSIATGCLFALYKDEILMKIQKHWQKVFYASVIIIFSLPILSLLMNKINLGFVFIPLGKTHGTIANFAIGFIMMYSIFGPRNLWFNFLNLKVINYIGILSYSIYLWQQIFISGASHWVTTYPQNLLFIFIIAMSSYHFIEKPFLKLKTKFEIFKPKASH
ncbi:MAG: acyltransferase [Phycisphaerales bacterium]|nr:acyltransferase [Phycisphaerales bacterium]